MKKTYIEPKTETFVLKMESLLGSLSGDGVNMKINNTGAEYDGDSRGGGAFWDDED